MSTVKIRRTSPPVESTPVAPPPALPKPEHRPEPKTRVKAVGGRRWWLLWTGIGLIVAGVAGFVFFAGHPSAMILGVGSIIAILGGGIAVYYGLQQREEAYVWTQAGKAGKNKLTTANALVIRDVPDPELGGIVEFVELPDDQLLGQPRKCRNDNKYYFVMIADLVGKMKRFTLPDTQYRSPGEASLYLRIPAHRRLAQRKASLMEKISPIILVVAILIIGIVWIATTPTGPQTTTEEVPVTQEAIK